MKKGDWIKDRHRANDSLNYWNEPYGRIKSVYSIDGQLLADVEMWSHDGQFYGRISPVMGGPRKFEPAVPLDTYVVVEKPAWAHKVKL